MANNDSFNDDASNSEQELDLREQLLSCHDKSNRKMMCELFDMKAGKFISASQISNVKTDIFQYPCYGGNGLRGYVAKNNKDGEYVLVGRQGALCGNVCYVNESFYATEHAVVVADKGFCIPRYTFHLLTFADLNQYKTSGAQPGLSVSRLEKIELYVPSLERQQAIVDILDTFTDAISNLEEELALREKQFEFYREQLLSCHDTSNRKMMCELFDMKAGKFISASQISNVKTDVFQYPCYGGNGLRGYVAKNNKDGEYVLVGRQGALCGNVCYVNESFYATEHAVVVADKGCCIPRYTFHLLTFADLNQYKTSGAQPGLSVSRLEKIELYVPSLKRQQEIVEILDTFEAMIANIKEEIALRTKQYEYYREKLLSFGK